MSYTDVLAWLSPENDSFDFYSPQISHCSLCFFFAMTFYLVKYEINCSMLFSTLSIVGISL